MKKAQAVVSDENTLQAISENKAAVLMWEYYRDSKAILVADVREYRDHILAQLMLGKPVASVFLQFTKVEERT